MRSKVLAVFWSLIAAGAVGAALTVLMWDDGGEISLPGPTQAPTVPPARTAAPTMSPAPTVSPTTAPTAMPTKAPSSGSPPRTVAAKSVDCGRTPSFCSQSAGTMAVRDGELVSKGATNYGTNYANVPKTTMTWRILRADGAEAHRGDAASKMVVQVSIHNATDRTFVFPRREVALVVELNGETFHEVATEGPPFTMTPGGRLNARFDVPIAYDGDYRWRAKTWFYERK